MLVVSVSVVVVDVDDGVELVVLVLEVVLDVVLDVVLEVLEVVLDVEVVVVQV